MKVVSRSGKTFFQESLCLPTPCPDLVLECCVIANVSFTTLDVLAPIKTIGVVNSAQMWALILVARSVFQSRGIPSLQSFPEDPRPYGSRILCNTIGPTPYLAPAVLAKSPFPIPRLASGMLSPQDGPSLCLSCSPLDGPLPVSDRHPIGTDL